MKNFQPIIGNVTANYDKRRLEMNGDRKGYLAVYTEEEDKRPMLNITMNVSDEPDDDITISFEIEEFLVKLGRVMCEYDNEAE